MAFWKYAYGYVQVQKNIFPRELTDWSHSSMDSWQTHVIYHPILVLYKILGV